MDFDKKEISSYLDGVPFSVGPKFCPPRAISLPFAISYQLPADLLANKYDFSLENKVLAFCQAREEANERLKEEENDAKNALEHPVSETNSGDGNTVNPSIKLWNSDSILQPKSQVPDSKADDVPPAGSESLKKINISDFEIDTRSPFDFMELQTINDLEELSTVFQGMCTDQKAVETAVSVESNKFENSETSMPASQSIGNVSKSISFPLVQNFQNDSSIVNSCTGTQSNIPTILNSTLPVSKSFSKNSDGYFSYSSPSVSAISEPTFNLSQQEKSKRNSLFSDNFASAYPALSQVPCVTSFTGHSIPHSSNMGIPNSTSQLLRSSKSISDLTNMLPSSESASHAVRSHTPPAKVHDMPESGLDGEITFVKNSYIQHTNNCSNDNLPVNQSEQSVDLPDPYEELSSGEKQIVDSITDMGFHRGQVSRTVKHLGTDQKKVVEHLCQIQVFEESGYDRLEAEVALHLHDYDKNEAMQYLDLLNQFQDLGFEKDAIKKALVQNKNDRDKVIDALLS